jgi:hypothetical protein
LCFEFDLNNQYGPCSRVKSMLQENVGNFVDLALEDIVELLSRCHVSTCIKNVVTTSSISQNWAYPKYRN